MLLPVDPFALFEHPVFTPAARREMTVFGAPVELLYLPERKARPGVPRAGRSAFPAQFVERILGQEAVWEGNGVALTPNRYPFARRQAVFWAQAPLREPDAAMLELLLRLEEKVGGTVLLNSVGAAASIPRCHLQLLDESLDFVGHFDTVRELPDALAELPSGVACFALAPPFPGVAVGVRGSARERAGVVHRLLEARSSPAFNLVSQDSTTWVFPRSAIETPAPHFPHALGAAELWGRWCFSDEEPFRATTPQDLEVALQLCCYPRA
ncbi:MAG: hypothetical protein ACYTKC_02400 [Planctomycetota bacterium]|jgi:hypothetical protein